MIIVKTINYDDYHKRKSEILEYKYSGLWAFEKDIINYTKVREKNLPKMIYLPIANETVIEPYCGYFPPGNVASINSIVTTKSDIYYMNHYRIIHTIETEEGIIFSDGRLTNGICHKSKKVQQWLDRFYKRIMGKPEFVFVE